MGLLLSRIPAIRPRGLSEISGWQALSFVSLSTYPNGNGVPVSRSKTCGSSARWRPLAACGPDASLAAQ
jgi:hypothetical protein